jgi:hypothetical protein
MHSPAAQCDDIVSPNVPTFGDLYFFAAFSSPNSPHPVFDNVRTTVLNNNFKFTNVVLNNSALIFPKPLSLPPTRIGISSNLFRDFNDPAPTDVPASLAASADDVVDVDVLFRNDHPIATHPDSYEYPFQHGFELHNEVAPSACVFNSSNICLPSSSVPICATPYDSLARSFLTRTECSSLALLSQAESDAACDHNDHSPNLI